MQHVGRMFGALFAATVSILVAWSSPASGYTPESPEVRSTIRRAIKYLSQDHFYDEGHRALAAMAMLKAGEPETHPLIAESIKECLDMCRTPGTVKGSLRSVYSAAVVGLFLCELDPIRYEKEIKNVIQSLEDRQKPFGGWGYPKPQLNWELGDTSMTQYAILCAWLARTTNAAEISRESIQKVTNWLIRTQDPSGAWGYQGRDPGVGTFTRRIPQSEVRHSLCVAGLGSLYICSGILGVTPDITQVVDSELPSALKPIQRTQPQAGFTASNVDEALLKRAIRDGNRWYDANYRINPPEYTMYYLYTLERYQSFKEIAEGRFPKEPRWYNDGVRFLRSKQQRDGSWDLPNGNSKLADTSFAILFLVRGTQKMIAKSSDEFHGLLVGGKGLPSNTEDVRLRQGRIVAKPFQGPTGALLEVLNNEEHPDFDSASSLDTIPLSEDPAERELQQARMRQLVKSETYTARLIAVKTLARIRNLDNVPALIYGLSDPDIRVMVEARDGLRFISRKFVGFGLSDAPRIQERKDAIESWKKWYREIRPTAFFLENER